MTLPANRPGLESIRREVLDCCACDRLVRWRESIASTKRASYRDEEYWGRAVPGFGDPNARLLVVGLAPGAHGANRTGRLFTGDRSGEWLFRSMHRMGFATQPTSSHRDDGLALEGAYVTAVTRCAPPANKPSSDEIERCRRFLVAELSSLDQVAVIVALGGVAFYEVAHLLSIRPKPRFAHLCEVDVPGGPTLIASYHPSQQNTFTGRLTEVMLDAVFERARALCGVDAL